MGHLTRLTTQNCQPTSGFEPLTRCLQIRRQLNSVPDFRFPCIPRTSIASKEFHSGGYNGGYRKPRLNLPAGVAGDRRKCSCPWSTIPRAAERQSVAPAGPTALATAKDAIPMSSVIVSFWSFIWVATLSVFTSGRSNQRGGSRGASPPLSRGKGSAIGWSPGSAVRNSGRLTGPLAGRRESGTRRPCG